MKTGKVKTINKANFQILNRIHEASGLSDFWLGGSTTYRKAAIEAGFNLKQSDYDLAIIGGLKEFSNTIKMLRKSDFFITKSRPFYLKFNKSFEIMASRGDILLDIAIIKDLSHWGHFNWESIFWHFPSGEIHDPYGGLKALKEKNFLPIISPAEENPFILASRFAKLCARFNIDFCSNKQLFNFAEDISKRILKWRAKDFFHGKYAKGYGYFYILQAILTASKRSRFISDLRRVGIFEAMFPEISEDISFKSDTAKKIGKAKNIKDMVLALESSLDEFPYTLKKLKKRFEIISGRLEKVK